MIEIHHAKHRFTQNWEQLIPNMTECSPIVKFISAKYFAYFKPGGKTDAMKHQRLPPNLKRTHTCEYDISSGSSHIDV